MFRHRLGTKMILGVLTGAALLFSSINIRAERPANNQDPAAQAGGRDVTIPVTIEKKNNKERAAAGGLKADDFSIREKDRPQTIVSVTSAAQAPPIIEILIQDDLTSRLDNEIRGIKAFITGLPEGSRIMTGYVTAGTLNVAQTFTTDRQRAAGSLRIVRGPGSGSPYDPYIELSEALRLFDSQPAGRRVVLFISDGLDTSHGFWDADPNQSMDLSRAIRDAQERGVAVFSFFAPGVQTRRVSMATNFGQGSLDKLTSETGGDAMFEGTTLVTFSPFLKQLQEELDSQYLITYHSVNIGAGFRPITVSTENGVKMLYPKGYWVK
jgi:VWFA-related protein